MQSTPVRKCVVDSTDGGVALIVQATVGNASHFQEGPHISIAPIQDGVDPHEGGPAGAAGAEGLLAIRIGVPSAGPKHT